MFKIICFAAAAAAAPALGPFGNLAVPVNLPANETALYPPYTYVPPQLDGYSPKLRGIPLNFPNATIKPWKAVDQLQDTVAAARTKRQAALEARDISPTNPSTFWYSQITHNGISPFISNGNNWQVYRNVKDTQFGARGDGSSDDSTAIQNAINLGNSNTNRASNNLGTTGQPAVVYIPSGTYILNKPIQLYVGTVLMGDPINPPTLKAGAGFQGSTLVYGKDPNQGSTTAFYIAMRNLRLDSTAIGPSTPFTLLDWSVSQACQLTNVVFNMPNFSSGHVGLDTPEGGSGLEISDLTFLGGATGIRMTSQQIQMTNIVVNACTTGIWLTGFTHTISGLDCKNSGQCIDASGTSGSVTIIDSTASSSGTLVKTNAQSTGFNSIIIENFVAGSGLTNTVVASGTAILRGSVAQTWVYGNSYTRGGPSTGSHQSGTTYTSSRVAILATDAGKYPFIKPPTYKEYDVSQFVNVKTVAGHTVRGDGQTDDTASLNAIISMYAGSKILFFPGGTYLVSDTITFPIGSRVVGEVWSAISATGSRFFNPTSPVTMVKVGNPGDVGVAQFSDMLFTTADVLQGCKLVEVNMAGQKAGDVGFWNSHFRIGGAAGSLVNTNCNGPPASCKAAWGLLHLTSSSSAYINNMWAWTADHNLDGAGVPSVSTGRGILIEAIKGTWLIGTGSEHNTLYQYNFNNAQNVYAAMQQSETPYWQGSGSPSLAPAPWTVQTAVGDPSFSYCDSSDARCRMALYNRMSGSSNIFIYTSGFWTFFNNHNNNNDGSGCGDTCQTNAIEILSTTKLHYYGVNTKSNINVIRESGATLVTMNNNPGGWGATVAAYLYDV